MFEALTEPLARWWLTGLLALWALFLFGGFAAGSGDPQRRMPTWTRMASSITLAVAALSWAVAAWSSELLPYALLIAAGMAFGLLGDLTLAGVLPGGRSVLGGMAAFGLGHLLYIGAFLWFGGGVVGWSALVVWWLVGTVGWYLIVYRRREPGKLVWAALAYAILLSTTAGLAMGLAGQESAFVPLAVGAALFLLSDLILAGELFAGLHFRYVGDLVWLTYGPAQMLIVYSVGSALAAAGVTI